ncbi:ATP-binding protein [Saccharopolyspora sp. NPDC003752]
MSVSWQPVHSGGTATTSSVVEVRAAARPGSLTVMRVVAADIAMRADFDVDAIADVRLAVEEACASLVKLAAPEEPLVCRFRTDDCRMAVTAEVTSAHPVGPSTATLSWRVLTALADSVTSEVLRPAHCRPLVRIEMTKEVDTG